jgi:DNA-binding LacI/PurR family transcriptional regulator/signal transduction histidine kinase
MAPPRTIGVLIGYPVYESNTINEYLLSVFDGIRAAARRYGCNVLIASGLNPAVQSIRDLSAWPFCSAETTFVPVGPWNTDGWIVIPPVAPSCSQYLDELRAGGFPMVFTEVDRRGPSMVTDNAHSIFQAVEHLWQHGHRQIAYIAGHENVIGDSSIRLEAFHATLRAFHTEPDSRLIAYSQHTVHGGKAAMEQLLDGAHPFTAVVASNLRSAIDAMKALRATGRRIPDDVALIAVDDHVDAEAQVPPITTVHLQTFEQGAQALRVLLEYLDEQHDPATTIPIPTHLVIRRSCGCQFHTPAANRLLIDRQASVRAPRAAIIQWMTEATRSKANRLAHADLAERFRLLLDGFAQSLAAAQEAPFLTALDRLLAYIEAAHEDPYILQEAISVLAQHIDTFLDHPTTPQITALVHELIDGSRVVIDTHVRQFIAQGRVAQAVTADRLGTMTAQLLATLDAAEILRIMATYLPEIGIQHAQIVMLEAEEDDLIASSVLWLRDPASGQVVQRRVSTSAFPAPDLYPANRPFQLMLVPLLSQATQIGYIAYDAGRFDVCGAITRHVAAALISSRLYREAAEGRRLAEEADQLKTRFLSMVSHELRTPLSLIVGLSELTLREQIEGKPTLRQDLERIYSSAHHLSFLIHDVLDLASSQAGQLRLTSEALDVVVVEVLQSVIAIGGQLAYDKGLAWHVTLPEHRPAE